MSLKLSHSLALRLLTVVAGLLLALCGTARAATPESIVLFDHGLSALAERALITSAGGQVTRQLHIIDAVGARLTPAQVAAVRTNPHVVSVSANSPVRTTAAGNPATTPQCSDRWAYWCPGALQTAYIQSARLDKTWTDPTYASTGKGIGVAVVDTGIDGNLPDFQVSKTNSTSRVIASVVTNPNATTAADLYGHGTHVAGILAGNSKNLSPSDPNYNSYIGAAPNANLVSVKVSDDHGNASVLDVINGLQFVVDNQAAYNIRVVNLSLASSTAQSYLTDPLDAAVEAAWFHGITVVTAAGNLGSAADAVDFAPANDPYVIAVGAVDDHGTKDTTDDTIAPWSSRGITQDGFAKPDVYAPGMHIVAPLAPGSDFASLCPACVRDTNYFQISGTSMAAPVVAGMVADLLAAHPSWTPTQVKSALTYNESNSKTDVRATADGGWEVAGDLALNATSSALGWYTGKHLVPNEYINPSTGSIDYTRASWSRASWSNLAISDPLRASWSRASWSCLSCSSTWTGASTTSVPTRASWSVFFGDTPGS